MTEKRQLLSDSGGINDAVLSEELQRRCRVEIYDPKKMPWSQIRDEVIAVEHAAFGDEFSFDDETIDREFQNPETTVVLMRDTKTGKLVGFTYAEPTLIAYPEQHPERMPSKDTAYISDTALHPAYQGRGLVVVLMQKLEGELVRKGYVYIERDSSDVRETDVSNETYADKVRKNYTGRIVREMKHDSEYGPQVFFRIRLLHEVGQMNPH